MNIFFTDIETTGQDHNRHSIYQIAGIIEQDGLELNEFDIRMRPNPLKGYDKAAFEKSRYTLKEILTWEKRDIAFGDLVCTLMAYHCKFYICGFNCSALDIPFLRELFKDHGYNFYNFFHSLPLDVMVLAGKKLLDQGKILGSYSLHSMCRAFDIPVETSKLHDAGYDTQLTRLLFKKL